jgi:triacylglycerol lipase
MGMMMLMWLGWMIGAAILATVAIYLFAPGLAYRMAMAMARRAGRLRLREITVDGHRMPYLEGGTGEPLLLLHGFGANKDHWTLIAPHLTKHFRVIAPDLPGFGDATRLPGERYGPAEQVARIAAFADAVGLERFHLGGNSMGGYLAALFAARHPERLLSLWLLAPAGAQEAAPSEVQVMVERGDNPLLVDTRAALDRLTDLCFRVPPYVPSRFLVPLLERARREYAFNRYMFDQLFSNPMWLDGELGTLEVPALVVWGDSDRVLHPSGLDALRRFFARGEFVMMSAMGHVPMIERPAETAHDFLRFHRRPA